MNGALSFSRPSKKLFGVSAVKSSGSSLTGVLRWVFFPQDTMWCSVPRQWGFCCPRLKSWSTCNFEPVFPRFHQSEELREDWTSKKSFSVLNNSQSYLCPTRSWKLSTRWLLQRNLFRCRWWWYLGSHVLQWILSQQLDMTRCPMTVWLRCVLLSLSRK